MNILNKLNEVINTLADMHDIETDKNYPEEKCNACICQEELQEVIDYIVKHPIKAIGDKRV